ncbi:MAG: hypothetical protein MUE36_08745 [Acidimicrobiales bacterium]|jgi:mannose-6-phosphate isomerase-like protein (cupin superfamily)|nr:hypothetical protein [Acidimicrobiales bacterium]
MRYLHLVDAADGSAFAPDGELDFDQGDFAPPGPPMGIATDTGVPNLMFIRMEAGWSDAAHPAPARQWMLVMSGRGETTAGGETRQWQAGDVVLVEDTSAPGHATTVFEDAVLAVVRF